MLRSLAFVAIAASASAQDEFPQDSILTAQGGTIEARSLNGGCVPAQTLRVAIASCPTYRRGRTLYEVGQGLSVSLLPARAG